ncbi:MAG: hypothetical protein AAF892_03055 [Cyanobacteria bacterium P01_D01_bin.71]
MSNLNLIALILGILVSGLSLLTGVVGAIAWHTARTRKQYAAERDFAHLKRNYQQLTHHVEWLMKEFQERSHDIARQLDRIEAKLPSE